MKRSMIITAGIFYFASLVTNADAQNTAPASNRFEIPEPLMVKYLGTQDDYLIFRVEIKTADTKHSTFTIEDAIEGELYSNPVYTTSKYQVLKIEKRENQVLDFKLVSARKVYLITYTTDSNDKLFQKGLAVL